MSQNVRGPITGHVLTYARGKMPGGFADIAGITASTQKLVYHTCTEPTRDRIFHTKHVIDFKGRKDYLNINVVTITFNKMANLFLRNDRKRTNVR